MGEKCSLCPRECGADRTEKRGFCGADDKIYVAKAYLHKWEEPPISGDDEKRGSGTIFFSNCQLRCPFCQNFEISQNGVGKVILVSELAKIMLNLQNEGAYNINLVSPTPYLPQIIEAIRQCGDRLKIPVAMNTGGYEKAQIVEEISPYVRIFLPDVKFYSKNLSQKYLKAPDYFDKAVSALGAMINEVGAPIFDSDGIMKSGVIVRHLVMPGCYRDSLKILEELHSRFGNDSFLLSLMSQYTPLYHAENYSEINRKITTFEYEKVLMCANELGFSGFSQQKSSADEGFVPNWDFEGID